MNKTLNDLFFLLINRKYLLLFISFFLMSAFNSYSQWQNDVRLTIDAAKSYKCLNNASCIVSVGDDLHLVWHDNRVGNFEIYYKRSTDAGLKWGEDIRLTNNSAVSQDPTIFVSGSTLFIFWSDNRIGNYAIFYKYSSDEGITWSDDFRITHTLVDSFFSSASQSGSDILLVWEYHREGNSEIFYNLSTDKGMTWSEDFRLTNDSFDSEVPSISLSGQNVLVVWQDNRDGNYEIYYKRSSNKGISWDSEARLTNNTADSRFPSIAIEGQNIHVVWSDNRDGNWKIYYNSSSDGGETWQTDSKITNLPDAAWYPAISISGKTLHVVWYDHLNKLLYIRSTNKGISWETETQLTSGISGDPSILVLGNVVNVIWSDERDGNSEIYYKRNPTGNP